jgi:hypothetical protein
MYPLKRSCEFAVGIEDGSLVSAGRLPIARSAVRDAIPARCIMAQGGNRLCHESPPPYPLSGTRRMGRGYATTTGRSLRSTISGIRS